MTDYVVKPLDANTWDAFSRLVERHNGVFGGCWCRSLRARLSSAVNVFSAWKV